MFDYKALYDYRFKNIEQSSRDIVWQLITQFIHRLVGPSDKILDPAAGRGEFIKFSLSNEKWVIDQEDYIGWKSEKNVRFIQGDCFGVDLPSDYFDLIFVSNLLEHLNTQYEIQKLLLKLKSALKSTGTIIIMGPNFKFCYKEYFDCADHVIPLTHISIEEHLKSAGLNTYINYPQFLPYSFRSRLPNWPFLVRLYLKYPLAWKLFGKQFLVLANKK